MSLKSVLSLVAVLSCISMPAAHAADEIYFVEAEGEIAGKPFKFRCERKGMAAKREFGDNFYPSQRNAYRSYQVSCSHPSGAFSGASVKYLSTLDILKEEIPAYPDQGTEVWENMPKVFTMRVKNSDGELKIHSFNIIPQHYTGTPKAKITEFKEENEGGKIFHTIGGEAEATFEDKVIKGNEKGSAGRAKIKFRTKVKAVILKH